MPRVRPPKAPEITVEEFASAVERGEDVGVLDVRAPARVAAGRIECVREDRFQNVVGSKLLAASDPAAVDLPRDRPVAVVCGHGNSSKAVAAHLGRMGFDVRSLKGGMAAWMNHVVPRPLDPPSALDTLVQFDRLGKGSLGYLLVSDGEALIIDPPREPEPYLDAARNVGARVVGVADTHVHADYISGAPRIAESLGVPYHLHPADAIYPYDGTPGNLSFASIEDGSAITFGRCSLRVIHTPGHTDGSVTYVVDEAAAFTGDFIFVRSLGRPDLAGRSGEWTEKLWASVEAARTEWPKDMVIYPAHYAAETERRADRSVGASLADLLRDNEPLTIPSLDAFRTWVEGHPASFPDAYKQIKAVNVRLRQVDEREAEELEVGKNECAV